MKSKGWRNGVYECLKRPFSLKEFPMKPLKYKPAKLPQVMCIQEIIC